ncbi:MAG: DUF4838 domain-containing protein [Opitutales bacterium]
MRLFLPAFLFFICGALTARTVWWKPERLPGSNRLALEDVRYLYLPPEPSERLAAAAEDLARHWPWEIQQREADSSPSKQSIVLLRDESAGDGAFCAVPDEAHDTGYFSLRRDRTRVYLRAVGDEGLAHGLYAIARELLGARWYWAGDLGFERVGEVADAFPDRAWRERPAFVQGTLHPVDTDFGRRNGLNRRYAFNHNLARIFTPEVYEASPEVFAEIGGEHRLPGGSAGTDPQPDFTHPGAVDLAVDAAREHFEEHPEANSFSLSINDNSLFDEGAATEAVVRGAATGRVSGSDRSDRNASRPAGNRNKGEVAYFRGRPNYTDLVFGFMNEVAEEVFRGQRPEARGRRPEDGGPEAVLGEVFVQAFHLFSDGISYLTSDFCPQSSGAPRRYLTALAYYWTEQSPSFELHPRIMPVLTSDRAQWHDPGYRAEDKALIRRWADSGAERIATWDYYFGAPYPYPRQFTQWIGESIPYLHAAGVDVFFSQLPSVWGLDGPKAWLTAELLRDPGQDSEVLLDEYYENFFGPAAEPIRRFYEIAEQTRNARAGTANWIKFYKDEAGIELFTPESLARMRDCLDRAKASARETPAPGAVADDAAADPDRFLERVRIVSEAFAYTEAYAEYHRSRVQVVDEAMAALRAEPFPADGTGVVRALNDYRRAMASFHEVKQAQAEKPMQEGFSIFNGLKQSDPLPLVLAALFRSDVEAEEAGFAEKALSPPMLRAWEEAGELPFIRAGKNPALTHSGTELRNFLGPELPVMDAWRIEYRASEGLRIGAARGREASGLRVENADIVSLAQTYPVAGEKTYVLEIAASWQVSPDNRTRVQLNWRSMSGEKLRTDILLRLPNGRSAGTQPLRFLVTAPVSAYDLKAGIVTNRQYEGDFLEIKQVEFGELLPEP